jgi:hypothetical protein
MMCRFLSADIELSLKCPADKLAHRVRLQAYPQLRGHALDVVACDALADSDQLTCGKNCRALLENGHYWQRIYPETAEYLHNQ